jgi:thiosulfate dehydrogenase
MGRILLGIILGIVLAPLALMGWFRWGHPPVAVADHPLPEERMIVNVPLHARIDREMPATAPIEPTEDNLVAGAQIYHDQCSSCHGFHGKPSDFANHMFPQAPPLWETHHNGKVVGVSDDPPGETYWKISNGIRLSGMPSYSKVLSEAQMWQVALLLANADKPLPPGALAILNPETAATPAADPAKAGKTAPAKAR